MSFPEEPELDPMLESDAGEAAPSPLFPSRPAEAVSYRVRLGHEQRARLGARVVEEVRRYDSAVEQRKENLREWRADYDMTPYNGPVPWEGGSALRAPLTRIAAAQHATRLNGQIVAADPPFAAKARKPEAQEHLQQIEEGLAAVLQEADWKSVARDVHREITGATDCAVCVTYERKTIRVPKLMVDLDQEVFAHGAEAGLDPMTAYKSAFKTDAAGQAKIELRHVEETVYDGVRLTCVPFEDCIFLPVNATDPDKLWGIGERVRLRGFDLVEGANAGKYERAQVKLLLQEPGDALVSDDVEDADDFTAVELDGGVYEDALYREYNCVELCWYGDLDGDRHQEWYLLTVHLESGRVLRCQYSPYEHGRAYYVPFRYLPRKRQLFSQSVSELLATTQDGATAAINNFFDLTNLLIGMAGSAFVDEDSGLDPARVRFHPGMFIKCQDPKNNILPLDLGQNIPAAMEGCLKALELLKSWAELLAGVSNPVLGKEAPGSQTLGEVQMVLTNAMAVFEDNAVGVALQWAKVWDLVRWTVAQYSEGGTVKYRRSADGEMAFDQIPAHVLTSDIDLVPAGIAEFADVGARIQRDVFTNQMLMSDPVLGQDTRIKLACLEQTLQDLKHPKVAELLTYIKQALQMHAQLQQMMQQAQLQATAQQGAAAERNAATEAERAAGEQTRAEEEAEFNRAERGLGIAERVQGLQNGAAAPAGAAQ